jgi:assimilatory nitrate reductase catalytic subunit
MSAVRTTCAYCGVGCGIVAEVGTGRKAVIKGDPAHPANHGKLCSKGTHLGETVGLEGRLLYPEIGGKWKTWDKAIAAVAKGFSRTIAEHGPDSVAFYVSGQLLTEDYYVANKLMKGFIGTANIDTNSRLCMASAVAGHIRAFGEDVVPVDYTDLESADLLVLVGSNLAWCHPVLMQRIQAERERRPTLRLVVIDPRRTSTTELADLHLPLRSGTDVQLFNGLLAWLAQCGHMDRSFIDAHTTGMEQALVAARASSSDVQATSQACGIDVDSLQKFFDWFAATDRVVTVFSQGVNQSSAGVDKVNSIINCHLLTGRIGREGCGPFSITGQPNAMGGREVGGLATQLAAHLELANPEHRAAVQGFWQSPRMPKRNGLKAVEMFDAIASGQIKAVWIMATNPVVSMPDADRVKRALAHCPLVIVSDCVAANDSLPFAHIKLPAAGWGEKDGTVTNSDRHISRQRAFLPLPGAARADWWIVCEVAKQLGYEKAFAFENAAEIFDEHVRLTALAAGFGKALDLTGLTSLTVDDYAGLTPLQWPVTERSDPRPRPFADFKFSTPDGRARFVATPARAPRFAVTTEYPLVLNTGRMRDQWHTMTRTARAPALNAHEPEPYIDAHADDLAAVGIKAGQLAQVVTRWGKMWARARSSGDLPAGMLFAPIHFNDQFARQARVGAAVNPVVDPLSGEPEFKHTPARLEPLRLAWQGFLLSSAPASGPPGAWHALSIGAAVRHLAFAGHSGTAPDGDWLRQALPLPPDVEWLEYEDRTQGQYRAALISNGELLACLMISSDDSLPGRGWLQSLFSDAPLDAVDRQCLLLGYREDRADPGATVCACHGVGTNSLREAIDSGCRTLESIGARTRAGTNCGSCRPEITKLLGKLLQQPVVDQLAVVASDSKGDGHRTVAHV